MHNCGCRDVAPEVFIASCFNVCKCAETLVSVGVESCSSATLDGILIKTITKCFLNSVWKDPPPWCDDCMYVPIAGLHTVPVKCLDIPIHSVVFLHLHYICTF